MNIQHTTDEKQFRFFLVFFNVLCPYFSIDIFILSAVGIEFVNRQKKNAFELGHLSIPIFIREKFIQKLRYVGCIIKYYFDCVVELLIYAKRYLVTMPHMRIGQQFEIFIHQ